MNINELFGREYFPILNSIALTNSLKAIEYESPFKKWIHMVAATRRIFFVTNLAYLRRKVSFINQKI